MRPGPLIRPPAEGHLFPKGEGKTLDSRLVRDFPHLRAFAVHNHAEMSGITGFITSRAATGGRLNEIVARMTDQIIQRGPDDSGAWADASLGVALGSRRLAIGDLSPAGHQPMQSSCGRLVMAYNGEVHNFAALRMALPSRHAMRVGGEGGGQNFQRQFAIQPGAARAIHLSPPARAAGGRKEFHKIRVWIRDSALDFVPPYAGSGVRPGAQAPLAREKRLKPNQSMGIEGCGEFIRARTWSD
jgi:Glutamine amidotransferase domain